MGFHDYRECLPLFSNVLLRSSLVIGRSAFRCKGVQQVTSRVDIRNPLFNANPSGPFTGGSPPRGLDNWVFFFFFTTRCGVVGLVRSRNEFPSLGVPFLPRGTLYPCRFLPDPRLTAPPPLFKKKRPVLRHLFKFLLFG